VVGRAARIGRRTMDVRHRRAAPLKNALPHLQPVAESLRIGMAAHQRNAKRQRRKMKKKSKSATSLALLRVGIGEW